MADEIARNHPSRGDRAEKLAQLYEDARMLELPTERGVIRIQNTLDLTKGTRFDGLHFRTRNVSQGQERANNSAMNSGRGWRTAKSSAPSYLRCVAQALRDD